MNVAVIKRLRADLSLASCSMLAALIVLAGILVAEMLGPLRRWNQLRPQ
jgi:hypothetical protein